jgi:hypothetical protein
MVTMPPVNTDLRAWALKEIKRLEDENAALKEQLDSRPPHVGGKPPNPPEMPPAIPDQEKDQLIAQLNKQVDDLSEQVAKLQEQSGIK